MLCSSRFRLALKFRPRRLQSPSHLADSSSSYFILLGKLHGRKAACHFRDDLLHALGERAEPGTDIQLRRNLLQHWRPLVLSEFLYPLACLAVDANASAELRIAAERIFGVHPTSGRAATSYVA